MNLLVRFYVVAFLTCVFFYFGCNEPLPSPRSAKVLQFSIENAYNQTIIVERKGLFGERDSVLLEVHPTDRVQDVKLIVNDSSQRLYQVRSADARILSYFIDDADSIHAVIDYLEPANISYSGSPATESLTGYFNMVASSGQKSSKASSPFAGLMGAPNLNRIAHNYVDTTSSPAAALMVFNSIDFGKNCDQIESFVTRLALRFPTDRGIQQLKTQTIDYLAIFRKDLSIGDRAPAIDLPDTSGTLRKVDFSSSDFTLIDVCSSWYAPCILQYESMKRLKKDTDKGQLKIVSVSLDVDGNDWKHAVSVIGADWLQLRDSLVWQGPMLKNYLFDSIPSNFVVNRDGVIVAKAISADSLTVKIQELLKRTR